MSILSRETVLREALNIYTRKYPSLQPSKILIATAVDEILNDCETREGRADVLGRIAERKAELLPLESLSPVSQETFDVIDAVLAAVTVCISQTN